MAFQHKLVALSAIVALLLAGPAMAQREVQAGKRPYVHAIGGIAFPQQAGDFTRGRVVEYSPDARDVSVAYRPTSFPSPAELTIYVYPALNASCEQEFVETDRYLSQRDGFTGNASGETHPPMPGFEGVEQHFADYRVAAGAMGFDHPELNSTLWIACMPDDVRVKLRLSYEREDAKAARELPAILFALLDFSGLRKSA